MKQVVVHPERCVGCMQCMLSCATAHSRTLHLTTAIHETPRPTSRVHVGAGMYGEGFPNRCRHCDPAPCMQACLPGAISRIAESATVIIDPDICINCASCAMACPYGVIRFHRDSAAPSNKTIAVKCDNCLERQTLHLLPACVEACKTRALTFETMDEAMKRKTAEVAKSVSADSQQQQQAPGFALLNAMRKSMVVLEDA